MLVACVQDVGSMLTICWQHAYKTLIACEQNAGSVHNNRLVVYKSQELQKQETTIEIYFLFMDEVFKGDV